MLGFFFPDAFHFLFPAHSLTNLELLSQVGLILFMFVIGMELDFSSRQKEAFILTEKHTLQTEFPF